VRQPTPGHRGNDDKTSVNSTITTATDARMPMAGHRRAQLNGAAGFTSTAGHLSNPQRRPPHCSTAATF